MPFRVPALSALVLLFVVLVSFSWVIFNLPALFPVPNYYAAITQPLMGLLQGLLVILLVCLTIRSSRQWLFLIPLPLIALFFLIPRGGGSSLVLSSWAGGEIAVRATGQDLALLNDGERIDLAIRYASNSALGEVKLLDCGDGFGFELQSFELEVEEIARSVGAKGCFFSIRLTRAGQSFWFTALGSSEDDISKLARRSNHWIALRRAFGIHRHSKEPGLALLFSREPRSSKNFLIASITSRAKAVAGKQEVLSPYLPFFSEEARPYFFQRGFESTELRPGKDELTLTLR